jgi:hypothetical protein
VRGLIQPGNRGREGSPGPSFPGRSTPKSAIYVTTRVRSEHSPVDGISPPTLVVTSREPEPRPTNLPQSHGLDPRSAIQPSLQLQQSTGTLLVPCRPTFYRITLIQHETHMHDQQLPKPGTLDPNESALRPSHRLRVAREVGSYPSLRPGDVHPNTFNGGLPPVVSGAQFAQAPGATRDTNSAAPTLVAPARYVLLHLAERLTGYTVKAMQRKIERGDWVEGKVWVRAPDGRILVDMVGYHKWVEGSK